MTNEEVPRMPLRKMIPKKKNLRIKLSKQQRLLKMQPKTTQHLVVREKVVRLSPIRVLPPKIRP